MSKSAHDVRALVVAALPYFAGAVAGWLVLPDEPFFGRIITSAMSALLIPCLGVLALFLAEYFVGAVAGIPFNEARIASGVPRKLQLVTASVLAAATIAGYMHAEKRYALRIVECVENRQRDVAMDIRILGFAETPAMMAEACVKG